VSYRVEFAPEAIAQLVAIEEYIISTGAPVAAIRYVDAIMAYCESLDMFPERGTKREDLFQGLRVTNYRGGAVIAFLVDAEREVVSILGVFYGGQDYEGAWRDS
jgi:toxin ParE1/3/4